MGSGFLSGTQPTRGRAVDLFQELCELDAEAQERRLAELAVSEPDLAEPVRRLLFADAATGGPLEELRAPVADAAERRLGAADAAPPTHVGAWRLVDRIGEGGMGEVWLGEREQGGFEQRAAVKLVRAGMASAAVVDRFLVERQLLARLEHPSIAGVLDGGVAADGRPWFAMELVEGEPITAWADHVGASLDDRVRQIAEVADAVDVAHRALVVHRDLKPSNVLVRADGEPVLLDFGLAKLLDPDAATNAATRTELHAFTPAYAAPEQVLGEPVTTAVDVYALGVLLYELVTGVRPHRREARSGPGLAAEVAHETAVRPSLAAAAAEAPDAETATSAARKAAFARRLRGDLDTVILKAIAREPSRRYASAADFARDLRAWLARRPVAARPDTFAYRTSRFVRRHRVGVAAAALVVAALVAGLVGTSWQARRAARQAARAERVQAFLIRLFEGSDPDRARGRNVPARELLAAAARELDAGLDEAPESKAALLDAVAQIERRLGLVDDAERHARAALALEERLAGPTSLEAARARLNVAEVLTERGDTSGARAALEPALALFRSGHGTPDDRLRAEEASGELLMQAGDRAGGLALAESELARRRALYGEDADETIAAHVLRGHFLELGERFEEARAELADGLARSERRLGAGHTRTEATRLALAEVTAYTGDLAGGEKLYRETIDALVRTRGEQHTLVAEARLKLALVLVNQARYAEADHELAAAFTTLEAIGHFDAAACLRTQGNSALAQGRPADAAEYFAEALRRFREHFGPDHELVWVTMANLGAAQVRMGQLEPGAAALREAIAAFVRDGGEVSDRLRQPLLALGEAERLGGHPDLALATHRRLLAIAEKVVGPEHIGSGNARREIALDLLALGGAANLAESRRELDRAIAIRIAVGGPTHPRLVEWYEDSQRLAEKSGDRERAAADGKRAAEIRAHPASS